MINFPPAFDVNYYRATYPELKIYSDAAVTKHYEKYAEEQGRTCCLYDIADNLKSLINEAIKNYPISVLELGPFDNPSCIAKEEGYGQVKYFDVLDSDELKIRAEKLNRPFKNVPSKIDYVSPTGDLSIVDEKFDVVFSCHSIEHQMNLIKHLNIVESLLKDQGLYVLIIPDKRYCYDHYIPETLITEIIDNYVNNIEFRSLNHVLQEHFIKAQNSAFNHWIGEHGDFEEKLTSDKLSEVVKQYLEDRKEGKYIDVHSLRFTPRSFGNIIDILNELKLIRLQNYRLCHTIWGRLEFTAILRKL